MLRYLASCLDCQYISGLRHILITHWQADHILNLSEDSFPLQEYSDSARYIAGTSAKFNTAAQAKAVIIAALLQKKNDSSAPQ